MKYRHRDRGLTAMLVAALFAAPAAVGAGDKPPAPKADKSARGEIYLLEQSLKSLRAVTKIDLPERVYLKKTAMDGEYQHFLTDKRGQLGSPEKILLVGSTLRGDRIGGSRDRYYFLTPEGKWRRTEPPEIYYVQNDDRTRKKYTMTPGEESSSGK